MKEIRGKFPLIFLFVSMLGCKPASHGDGGIHFLGNAAIADPGIQVRLYAATTPQEVIELIGDAASKRDWLSIENGIWNFYSEWSYYFKNLDTGYELTLKIIFLNQRKWMLNFIS